MVGQEEGLRLSERINLAMYGMVGLALVSDFVNDLFPHIFDGISPEIEDHLGNMPYSMIGMALGLGAWEWMKEEGTLPKEVKLLGNVLVPVAVFAMMATVNAVCEVLTSNNIEMAGDFKAGLLGLGLVAAFKAAEKAATLKTKWRT